LSEQKFADVSQNIATYCPHFLTHDATDSLKSKPSLHFRIFSSWSKTFCTSQKLLRFRSSTIV